MEGFHYQEKKKKGSLIKKTWERCKSIGPSQGQPKKTTSPLIGPNPSMTSPVGRGMVKSKSWSSFFPSSPIHPRAEKGLGGSLTKSNPGASPLRPVSPKGCLTVYVGPDKQRFVVKIECTNHPLFRNLLEEAENEYGYNSNGPLMLPCEVDLFLKILREMDANDKQYTTNNVKCKLPRNRSSYSLLNSSSRWVV